MFTAIDEGTQIQRQSGCIVSDMDGETVMMSIDNGKYYNLGAIGGRIWSLIEQPMSVQQLITQLLEEYDVDRPQCEIEVSKFLDHLAAEKLVTLVKESKM